MSEETIRRCYQAAWENGAAIPVVPVVETVRQILPEGDSVTVDRDHYRLVQTPQVFTVDVLKKAYLQLSVQRKTDQIAFYEVYRPF